MPWAHQLGISRTKCKNQSTCSTEFWEDKVPNPALAVSYLKEAQPGQWPSSAALHHTFRPASQLGEKRCLSRQRDMPQNALAVLLLLLIRSEFCSISQQKGILYADPYAHMGLQCLITLGFEGAH